LGYFNDEFVHFFVRADSTWAAERKAPLINRGYYSRVASVRATLRAFLHRTHIADAHAESPPHRQVVVLGAGFDTLFFRAAAAEAPAERDGVVFFELDFPSVVQSKIDTIARFAPLAQLVSADWQRDVTRHSSVPDDAQSFVGLTAPRYRAAGVDLSDVDAVERRMRALGVDPSLPTLILSECVLIYIDGRQGDALLQWFARTFAHSAVLTYEQIRPDDAFGRMMLENLARRGCRLETLLRYPSLEAQRQRYLDAGWTDVRASTMLDIYRNALDIDDRRRIERLEIFDEMEEWRLFQTHYALVAAQRGSVVLDFPPPPPVDV
jgi:O-methyltransferase involved in polyketide biosynthesis